MATPLPRPFEKYIEQRVRAGDFSSKSEALKQALHLLKKEEAAESDRLTSMRAAVQKGIDAANAGKVYPVNEMLDRVRARVEQRNRSSRRRKSA